MNDLLNMSTSPKMTSLQKTYLSSDLPLRRSCKSTILAQMSAAGMSK